MIHEIRLQTKSRDEMLDITAQVEGILVQENVPRRTYRSLFTPYYSWDYDQ